MAVAQELIDGQRDLPFIVRGGAASLLLCNVHLGQDAGWLRVARSCRGVQLPSGARQARVCDAQARGALACFKIACRSPLQGATCFALFSCPIFSRLAFHSVHMPHVS